MALPHDSMPELADAQARIKTLEGLRQEDHVRFDKEFAAINKTLSEILVEVRKTNGRVTMLETHERVSATILKVGRDIALVLAGSIAGAVATALATNYLGK